MTKVVLYVEGGGDQSETKARLRQGISRLLGNGLAGRAVQRRPKVVVCGSIQNTLRQFDAAVPINDDAICVVLVDADGPVSSAHTPAGHLAQTRGWVKPSRTEDEQIHLMVQAMEAWIVADRETLRAYYGGEFRENQLSDRANVEEIPKQELASGLLQATRSTTKGPYHKINHASQLLARLNSRIISAKSPHFKRLLDFLTDSLRL